MDSWQEWKDRKDPNLRNETYADQFRQVNSKELRAIASDLAEAVEIIRLKIEPRVGDFHELRVLHNYVAGAGVKVEQIIMRLEHGQGPNKGLNWHPWGTDVDPTGMT